jgi:hypothetical protein
MPWLLDSAISTGGLDATVPNNEYTHSRVRLESNDPDTQKIELSISYGYMLGPVYVKGAIVPIGSETSYTIGGSDWIDLTQNHEPNPGEKTYIAARRGLYEYLAGAGVIPEGSIV